MTKEAYTLARMLWKERDGAVSTLSLLSPSLLRRGTSGGDGSVPSGLRKPWDKDAVVEELLHYLSTNSTRHGMPPVWMPRFSQFDDDDRGDLKNAISKFGGADALAASAGLVPVVEWSRFELYLEMLTELRAYLEEHGGGGRRKGRGGVGDALPSPSRIYANGNGRLSYLVRVFGGREQVAERLGMSSSSGGAEICKDDPRQSPSSSSIEGGSIGLELAWDVLSYVRSDMMKATPPVRRISLPTYDQLVRDGRSDLAELLELYGYNAVSERLGLVIDGDD